jgi:hypothetical protein
LACAHYLASFETEVVVPILARFLDTIRPSDDEFTDDSSEVESIEVLTQLGALAVGPQVLARLSSSAEATMC